MKKQTRGWLLAAGALVLMGLLLFAAVMTAYGWDFQRLSTVQYETNSHEIKEAFRGISIQADTADVLLLPSGDGKCRVVCVEEERAKHTVAVRDGKLLVELTEEKKWFHEIGINIGEPSITVYLPGDAYGALSIGVDTGDVTIPKDFRFESMEILGSTGDVKNGASVSGAMKITTSTGDISVKNLSAASLSLSVSTGDIEVEAVRCDTFRSSGNTGKISMENVLVAGRLSVERSTGDVAFARCDALEIFVQTDTGDVEGSLLSDKQFLAESSTGKVRVPRSGAGGLCEIRSSTGDIELEIA
mgnify:CR=1 FL=1